MKIFKRLIQKAAIAIAIGTAGVTATAVPLMPTENVLAETVDNVLDAYEAKAREFEEWADANNYEIELVDLEYWREDTMEGILENINNFILAYDMQMEETTEGPVYLYQLQLKYSPNENEGYKRTITFEDTNGNKIGEDVVQTEQKIPCWYIIDGLDLRRQIDGEDITKTEGWEEYTPSVNDFYADLQKDYVLLSPASIPEKLPTEDETVTVKFEKNTQTRTITFNANGGTGTMSKQNIKPGVAIALTANAFTRNGYTFNGWNTKADGTGTSYANRQSVTLNANTTLYAQWKSNTRTITFNANGGTGTMSKQNIKPGVAAALTANTFTRTGYVFNGWNSRADGKGTAYKDKQKVTFNASMTLYAQWKPHANGWVKENGGYKNYKDGKPYTGWHKMEKLKVKKPRTGHILMITVFFTPAGTKWVRLKVKKPNIGLISETMAGCAPAGRN